MCFRVHAAYFFLFKSRWNSNLQPMQLFYAPDIQEKQSLEAEEARHCIKVLRHKVGDMIYVIDGKGNRYHCQIVAYKKNICELLILDTVHFTNPHEHIHLAIAPTKNADRMEWMIEKVTEIGIGSIQFLQCQHSERKHFKTDRLEKKAISAMKQSLKWHLPVLHTIQSYDDFIAQDTDAYSNKCIAYVSETDTPHLFNAAKTQEAVLVLIGPEGDFSSDEIKSAVQNGFTPVSLGDSRLRTETAAIVACHTIQLLNYKQ